MHILFVSHNYPFESDPGFGFFCKQQAEALALQSHKIGVVCPLAYSIPRIVVKKRRFYFGKRKTIERGVVSKLFFFPSIPKWKGFRQYLINKIGMRMVDEYIREYGKPDVIHLHVFHAARLGIDASIRFEIPLVWTEHFSDIDRQLIDRKDEIELVELCKAATARVAVSRAFKASLEAKFGVSFDYIPNVYQSDLFKPDERRPDTNPFIFVTVGNLDGNKNQERLIRAFQLAFSPTESVLLKIVGDGEDWDFLRKLISRNSLEKQIEMTGYLSSAEVLEVFHRSHAFVLPSDYETFGVAVIEAMACGLPAIATKCGGPESIITSDRVGLLVEKNPKALAEAMRKLYENYQEYSRSEVARFAWDNFSYEAVGQRLTELYQKCTS